MRFALVPPVAAAWAVPQALGTTPGLTVACGACRDVAWEPWRGLPAEALPPRGLLATSCPACGRHVLAELAPDWGAHHRPYPRWLRHRLGLEEDGTA
ncbi:MAG: hypothetical protein RMJ05_07565 [Thermomicrobium sp.]|nr:hypothetical protein [Thermomicrobium sp.]